MSLLLKNGQVCYNDELQNLDILIEDFVNYSNIWLKKGCTILGGCCETKPEHISSISSFK